VCCAVQVRHGFIVKVLGLLSAQLTATAAIGAVLILAPSARMWLALNPLALFIAAVAAATCLIALACSEAARRQYPTNMILLSAFTLVRDCTVHAAGAEGQAQGRRPACMEQRVHLGQCCHCRRPCQSAYEQQPCCTCLRHHCLACECRLKACWWGRRQRRTPRHP
jgi:hypothetical protein